MEDVRFEGQGDYYQLIALTKDGRKLFNGKEGGGMVHRDMIDYWKKKAELLKLKIEIKE